MPKDDSELEIFPNEVVLSGNMELDWYCLYTRPRHEKSIARRCRHLEVPFYLPLRQVTRNYKSGKKKRWLPLFSGYVFCRPEPEEYHVLKSESNLLTIMKVGDPEQLERELTEVRKALNASRDLETVPYIEEGQRVKIMSGPFRGIKGVVTEVKNKYRVHLNVRLVNQSVPVEIDSRDVEPED